LAMYALVQVIAPISHTAIDLVGGYC